MYVQLVGSGRGGVTLHLCCLGVVGISGNERVGKSIVSFVRENKDLR